MPVLPGEPLDGTGLVCIHLFVQDPEAGSYTEPHALHPVFENGVHVPGRVEARPTRGRLACNPVRNPATVVRGRMTVVTPRTDDPRAVTCPKCRVSKEYTETMALLNGGS
jgi:hypothetical protein